MVYSRRYVYVFRKIQIAFLGTLSFTSCTSCNHSTILSTAMSVELLVNFIRFWLSYPQVTLIHFCALHQLLKKNWPGALQLPVVKHWLYKYIPPAPTEQAFHETTNMNYFDSFLYLPSIIVVSHTLDKQVTMYISLSLSQTPSIML